MPLLSFTLRRLAVCLPSLLIILLGVFCLLQLAPGDTVDALMAQMGGGDTELLEQLRRFYGLDAPVAVQLGRYLLRLVQLDLGYSAIYGKPVIAVIAERIPVTLLLMASALALASIGGVVLGVFAARHVHRWQDGLISTLGLLFYAMPPFWLGLMAVVVFAVKLGVLPSGGFESIGAGYQGWRRALDIAEHLALPTVTLSLIFLATYLRIMRASMLEVATLDFVRTARAKGVDEDTIVTRHILRNALLPLVTLIGLHAGTMLGGAVVVESVFTLPGLGRLAYESVVQRDLNTLLGIVFVSALLVIAVNIVVDLLYARLDPRIRVTGH